jgi:hypothetical protein
MAPMPRGKKRIRPARKKASFCEQKEAKKLYLCRGMGNVADTAHDPA